MKKHSPNALKLAFIFLYILSLTSFASAEDIPTSAYKNSVVAIFSKAIMDNGEIESSSGSGFVISKDGYILTTLHVTGEPALYKDITIDIYFPVSQNRSWQFKGPYVGNVVSVLPLYDLALIKLQDNSFLPTVPILALGFSNSIDEDGFYKGYGYNMLRSPTDRTPPFLIDASYSAPVSDLPFEVFQETSFNFGASGGPLLMRSTNLVVAIWHGRIAKFIAMDNQERPVNGLSWVIPMDMSVKDWLASNRVTLAASPPKYGKLDFTNGIASLKVGRDEITNLSNTASAGYVTAPLGSEIIAAELELNKQVLQCKPINGGTACDTIMINEKKALEVSFGRIAHIKDPVDSSAKINLTLKPNDEFYSSLDFQSIEFEAPAGPVKTSQQLMTFRAEQGKELLAASITLDASQNSIKTDIRKGAFAISKVPERRIGIPTFEKPEDIENAGQKTLRGTATLVIGNKGASVNSAGVKQIFDSAAEGLSQGKETMFESKIITP